MLRKLISDVLRPRAQAESLLAQALRHREAGELATAESCCRQRLGAAPHDADAWAMLALCKENSGDTTSALRAWRHILERDSSHAEALCAIGEPSRATGLVRGAEESAQSHAQRLQTARDMVSFWAQQDRLWRYGVARDPRIALPVWDGGSLGKKRVLIHSMRGYGDTIHFVRFASALVARGAEVRIACGRPLHRLLTRCPDIAQAVEAGAQDVARDCDVHAPLVVLLKHFFFAGLQRAPAPYLASDDDAAILWEQRLTSSRGLRVGICWAGDPANKNDARRSMTLAGLAPLLAVPGVCWVSLQKDAPAAQLAQCRQPAIHDWTAGLGDFADTAALMSRLDLVISVNTAVAHLAGALGKPVWILYSGNEDRRWEVVDDAQRLYPQARLFRQPAPGDWRAVAESAAKALRDEADRHANAAASR